jgi:hypothetical protein
MNHNELLKIYVKELSESSFYPDIKIKLTGKANEDKSIHELVNKVVKKMERSNVPKEDINEFRAGAWKQKNKTDFINYAKEWFKAS